MSCSRIAEIMDCGISKGSVIGKLSRLGAPRFRAKAERYPSKPRVQKTKSRQFCFDRGKLERRIGDCTRDSKLRKVLVARAYTSGNLPASEPVRLNPEPVTCPTVALLDLLPEHCRWPICDDADNLLGYCGQVRRDDRVAYCTDHCKRAFADSTS